SAVMQTPSSPGGTPSTEYVPPGPIGHWATTWEPDRKSTTPCSNGSPLRRTRPSTLVRRSLGLSPRHPANARASAKHPRPAATRPDESAVIVCRPRPRASRKDDVARRARPPRAKLFASAHPFVGLLFGRVWFCSGCDCPGHPVVGFVRRPPVRVRK